VGSAGDPALTIKGDTTAWDDHMDMRMVGERRAPGVENGEDADAGAEMFGIGRDGDQGLGRGLEQDVVDHGLVLVGDVANCRRQSEDDVEVGSASARNSYQRPSIALMQCGPFPSGQSHQEPLSRAPVGLPPLNGGLCVRHQVHVSSGAVYRSTWCSTLTKRFGGRG
jgi:hypothetical protein